MTEYKVWAFARSAAPNLPALEEQLAEVMREADRRGYIIVNSCMEQKYGTEFWRPDLFAMLTAVQHGRVNAVMVQSLDRLSHDITTLYRILRFLQNYGAVLITTETNLQYELYLTGLESRLLNRPKKRKPVWVFEQIRDTPYSQVAENRIRQESNLQKTKRAAAEKKIKAAQHALERFEGEILKCLDGTSSFTEDMIAKQIRRYQQELDDAKAEYAELQNARLNEAAEIRKLRTYYDDFKGWAEEFDTAPLEMKRMILSHLIDRVEVGRKYQVIVKFNMKYRQFLECTAETYNTEIGA